MANLEKSFFENMSIFFKPFYAQMEEMQKEVREAKTIAKNARSANLATQNEIHQLQQLEDVLAEKAIKTDMTLRQNNLKIRGLKEKLEKNEELSEIISKWLEKEPLIAKKEDIRYSWATPLILQFSYRSKVYRVTNKEEGFKILNSLDIITRMELSQQSLKRKQRSSSPSPPETPDRQDVEAR
ncbi:UNVERIFIED_CONTAM: hypothetical protein K2H54_033438 [Gekko kuhli]